MIDELAERRAAQADDELWCGVLFAQRAATGGLDILDVGDELASGEFVLPDGAGIPWHLDGPWTKPVVAAAQGLGDDAGDRAVAGHGHPRCRLPRHPLRPARDPARHLPFGGATFRFPEQAGWGNAYAGSSPVTGSTLPRLPHRCGQEWSTTVAAALAPGPPRSRPVSRRTPLRWVIARLCARRTWPASRARTQPSGNFNRTSPASSGSADQIRGVSPSWSAATPSFTGR
ncbi:hypothetical protein HBB16_13605 [Pseudonocardia sp. MCCB 268]|nr:hypothetical protein [Pseudonocardia cytotoxica]